MSILEIIQIVLIILKLVGLLHWSWWGVLTPLWIFLTIVGITWLKNSLETWTGDNDYFK